MLQISIARQAFDLQRDCHFSREFQGNLLYTAKVAQTCTQHHKLCSILTNPGAKLTTRMHLQQA
jgi:hypothetical protein